MTRSVKLRVLQLGSPTAIYGAERWILALVKHLSAHQVESVVAAIRDEPGADPPLCECASRLGVRTHVFNSAGKLSLSSIGKIRSFIIENEIDVLHTHGYKTDLIGLLAARGTRCRIVSTPHGWSADAGPKLQAYELLDRAAFPFFDAVVPLSPDLYHGLRWLRSFGEKLHLVHNGVDLSEIDSVGEPAPQLQALREAGNVVIGYIGQLIPRKGVATLLGAFRRLEHPRTRLCIIGEGSQRAELEALAARLDLADRVDFLGYREDRLMLLKGLDVFVLPSTLEGIPRCLLEAMSAGVAVVASDIPGCTDLVEDNVTGLLFECGDEKELANRLDRLASREDLRRALAISASQMVREQYSAAAMAQRYAALYASLAGREQPESSLVPPTVPRD